MMRPLPAPETVKPASQAFSTGELQRSWAAEVWTRAYDAKYQHVIGAPVVSLSEDEAHERLRRAGIGYRTTRQAARLADNGSADL
jgi:hypothetical protein